MGWTYGPKRVGQSPLDFIKTQCWPQSCLDTNDAEIVATAELPNVIYLAMKLRSPSPIEFVSMVFEPAADGSITFAMVYLIEGDTGSPSIGWKSMDETMGPYDGGRCPVEFLQKLSPLKPNAPGYALFWRQRQAKHAA
jgi:hypothetical protein